MSLDLLYQIDGLKKIEVDDVPGYINNDHRFVLPLVLKAQRERNLPTPCTLLLFDRHHDALIPRAIKEVENLNLEKIGIDEFSVFCRDKLSILDDDWIIAGMELGLFSNAVIFGVDRTDQGLEEYTDRKGIKHKIKILSSTPGELLGYQGSLSDLAKDGQLKELWEILEWEHQPKGKFKFLPMSQKVFTSFDLDCFAFEWEDYIFPWPDEVFNDRMIKKSNYYTTEGWSGKLFIQGLLNKSGLIVFTREPNCCGSDEKADIILKKINEYIFDKKIAY